MMSALVTFLVPASNSHLICFRVATTHSLSSEDTLFISLKTNDSLCVCDLSNKIEEYHIFVGSRNNKITATNH